MASSSAIERALILAAISGLRTTFGPALVAASYGRRERPALALAALGEMVVDKIPGIPPRSSLPMLLPRALAGFWVAREVINEEGEEIPWAGPAGAAVAVGAALVAPRLRSLLNRTLGIPDPVLGLAEDGLALTVGARAAGLSLGDLGEVGREAVREVREGHIGPAVRQLRDRMLPV